MTIATQRCNSPRGKTETRHRLQEAALELFYEREFDATTTAQISERAHVTERTYFRHFANKREVLFEDETELREVMTKAVDDAPPAIQPFDLVVRAYLTAVPVFVAGRPIARRRATVIVASPALREGALARTLARTDALSAAVAAHGFHEATARLAADVGAAIFTHAMHAWNGDPGADLAHLLTRAADTAQQLLCDVTF